MIFQLSENMNTHVELYTHSFFSLLQNSENTLRMELVRCQTVSFRFRNQKYLVRVEVPCGAE